MKALLNILERDALMPRSDIARLLDLTVEEVERRIAQLESSGVILGYQTIINHDLTEEDLVTAVIEVKITPERSGGFDRIAERIAKFDEVRSCYLMSGGYDLLVTVEAPDLRAVAAFVSEKLSPLGSVLSTATHFRLKTYKENGTLHRLDPAVERLAVVP